MKAAQHVPRDVAQPLLSPSRRKAVRYIVAWLLGVPLGVIVLWFLASQVGC